MIDFTGLFILGDVRLFQKTPCLGWALIPSDSV